jgi:RNA polymerase sigma factor (sigma-70 family)
MANDALDDLLRRAQDDAPVASAQFMNAAMVVIRRSLGAWANAILVDRGMLDDVAQEAALRVWVNRRRCRATTHDQTAGWIAAIARMTAIDHLRASGPRERYLDIETVTLRALVEPGSEAEPDARVQRLVELSWSLGSEASELLWSRLVLGQSWAEIGQDRAISWTAARRRYQRAVERLRVLALTDSDIAPSRSLLQRIARGRTVLDPDRASGARDDDARGDPKTRR